MKYRQCLCGQAVEERFTVCPYCKSEISAQEVLSGEPPKGPMPTTAPDRDDWYYMYEGHMVGPCTTELLQASVATGLLAGDTQVWAPGMKEWTTVGQVMDVPELRTTPPFTIEAGGGAAAAAAPAAAAVAGDPLAPAAEEPVFGSEEPAQEPSPAAGAGPEAYANPYPPIGDPGSGNFDASLVAGEPHPWLRWFARVVDMTVTAFVLGMVIGILAPNATIFNSSLGTSILVLLVWMVAEPFVLTHFENTPGKALLNIRLKTADGRSLKLDQAFQRSARVWFFGMGGGLPIVSLFTLVSAYNKLTKEGITSWDREGNFSVTHGPIGVGRMVAIGLFLGFYFLLNVVAAIA